MTPAGPASTATASSATTSFVVAASERPSQLVWAKPDSTWSWRLTEQPDGRTRLVTRLKVRYGVAAAGLCTVILMEFGDLAMMRSMLQELKG